MNQEKKIALQILSLAASAALLMADPVWPDEPVSRLTMEQAFQEGLGQSPTLKKYESARDQADWEKTLGMSGLLPHISLKAEHEFSTQYESVPVTLGTSSVSVPIVYPRTSFGVEANWTLFDGLANIRNFQASRDFLRASEQELSRKDFEIRKKIELAYFNALAAQRFEEVAEENVKTLQENLTQVRYRFDSGRVTQYDVLRVEVQLSDATTELERTRDNVVIERKKLAQAMGLSEDNRVLEGQLPSPGLASRVQSVALPDPSERQDFVAARLRSDAADKQANAALGNLAPAMGLSAHYEHYDDTSYPSQASGGFREAWAVGVFARWNILDGGASIARAGAAKASAARAEHEYQETVLTLPAEFELWKRRYIYSAHTFEAKGQDLKRSEESFRISKLSFQEGRKTITDVLEAETDLFRARAGIVQSQLDAEEALLELELAMGKDI